MHDCAMCNWFIVYIDKSYCEAQAGNTIGSTVDLFPHMAVNLICQIRWLISYARSDG